MKIIKNHLLESGVTDLRSLKNEKLEDVFNYFALGSPSLFDFPIYKNKGHINTIQYGIDEEVHTIRKTDDGHFLEHIQPCMYDAQGFWHPKMHNIANEYFERIEIQTRI